ncbi:hypothetical protein [Larkinella humicola]|uniref:Uncharacterized protein n=1 Tax=Larkinella humicola TaxID=2607654 RepID=A0A5N1J511_9BACT|nr:hypothetical protein [Larkinella humicola]KAA9341155.1 hypothetical protein F0P93_30435 [Larkinella humicola]
MDKNDILLRLFKAIQENSDNEHLDFALPGYAARQLISYQAIREDLMQCLASIKELMEKDHNQVVRTALWYSTISLYGKCFTDASTSKSSKLEVKDCFTVGQGLHGVHEQLMDLRHNLVAHRGETIQEIGIAYLRLRLHDSARGAHVRQGKFKIPKDLNVIVELLEHLIAVCEMKFEKATEKAWDHMMKTYTPTQMALLKIGGPNINQAITEKFNPENPEPPAKIERPEFSGEKFV